MRLVPRLRLRSQLERRSWTFALALAFLLLVEMLGARVHSDAGDAMVLCLLIGATPIFSRLRWGSTLAWVVLLKRVAVYLKRRWEPWTFALGVDLRLRPAVAAGIPPVFKTVCSVLVLAAVCIVARLVWIPVPLRSLVVPVFYLGWLTCLAFLWAMLLGAIALMLVLPPAFLHDQFAARWTGTTRRPRRTEYACIGVYFASALTAGLLLPAWVPMLLMGTLSTAVIGMVWIPPRPELALLWRSRSADTMRSLSWSSFSSLIAFFGFLPFLLLALLSVGPAALGMTAGPSVTPISAGMGNVLAWLSAWGMAVFSWTWFLQVRLWFRRDPAAPAPTTLHLTGAGRDDQARVREQALARGWQVRFAPGPPERTDVQLVVEDVAPSAGAGTSATRGNPHVGAPAGHTAGQNDALEATTLEGRSAPPLRVRASALEIPEFYEVVARRDVLQRQRILVDVLTALVGRAAQRRYGAGMGFWIAPQYWWCSAMSRDTDEEGSEEGQTMVSGIIPPYYHRVLPRPVRHHAYRVFGALAVDLVFLEDGVGAAGLRHVLQRLFAHYETHQGKRRIEEADLQGMPSVRVLVHDFEHSKPLRRQGYPEPDYEDLGRARIVHVFRDRGGPEDEVEPALDLDALFAGVR